MSSYLMENEEEIQRLERKTDAVVVERFARRAGLQPGMRVIDLCCGAGVTTSILGDLVGPEGRALGVDFSPERLAHAQSRYGNERVTFAQRDVRGPLEDLGTFDFAWVRFALEYFRAEAFDIVGHLTRVMNPGGIVCLVDLDHNCLNHFPMPAPLAEALVSVMEQLETQANFDPYMGRKLYSFLHRLGYQAIGAEVEAHHLIWGDLKAVDEYNWTRKIEVIVRNREVTIPGYTPQAFLDDFLGFFRDPARFTYTPVIACWGSTPRS